MKAFETIEIEHIPYLTYELEEQECVDHVTLGMLDNNVIPGIMPIRFVQIDDRQIFRFKPSYAKTMGELLEQPLLREQNLSIVKNIARIMIKIRDYMIPVSNLCMDSSYIYVNQEGDVELICLPVEQEEERTDKESIIALLKQWNERYFRVQGSVYWELYRLLENSDRTVRDFIYEIEKKEMELSVPANENSDHARLILDYSERVKRKKQDDFRKADESVILCRSEEYYDKTVSIQKRGRELAADEVFPDKLFPAEEMLNEEATVSLNSHTSEKGYLVRLSTQEKIPVNKSVFRIGKSRNGMDYYIDDNAAISRNHAIILQKEQHYYIIDTDSRNHIYLNGKMIPANQEIELPGYTNLRLADEEFLFFIEASS